MLQIDQVNHPNAQWCYLCRLPSNTISLL